MAIYYLIRGDQVVATIDSESTGLIGLPLMGGGDPMSLLNAAHVQALMASQGWTVEQALDALGLADLRATMLRTIFVGNNPSAHSHVIGGVVAYHLISIGDYSIWQCDGQQDDLLRLHTRLWAMDPTQTLGLLAVVQTFGSAFYPSAVRTATGMTTAQALERRNRVATYLELLGYSNTSALRAATNEHTQMLGIVQALGYTMAQLWNAMNG